MMRTTKKIIVSTSVGTLVALVLVIYRSYVIVNYTDLDSWLRISNHASVVVAYAALGLWLFNMADYRFHPAKDITTEYKAMKNLSYLASVMSLMRLITAAVYFWKEVQGNTITDLYVTCELAFWLVLTVFFFCFGIDRDKREKKLVERMNR